MTKACRLVSAVILLLSCSACAFTAEVTATVDIGYGGVCKFGHWNPVTVYLADPSSDIEGKVVVTLRKGSQSVQYSAPVSLAQSSKKQFTIYVPLKQYSSEISVQIFDGRRMIKEIRSRYRDAYDEDYLVVSAGGRQGSLNFLAGMPLGAAPAPAATPPSGAPPVPGATAPVTMQVQAGHLSTALLPDKPAGFDAVNMLVLTDLESTRVDPAVLNALRIWIASGGKAVVCGGADYARLKSPFFEEILPVSVQSSVEVPGLDAMAARYGFPLAAGNLFICQAAPKPGAAVMLSQGGNPLVVQGRYGLGSVTYLAFDPFSFPLKGWDGQMGLWKHLIASSKSSVRITQPDKPANPSMSPPYYGGRYGGPPPLSGMEQAALLMKSIMPPSLGIIATFLIAYLVFLVPLNYFYIRKKDRFELAWITTPAVILFFTLGAYAIGYATRGTQTIMNRIMLIETASDTNTAAMVGYLGLYSPSRARYAFEVQDRAALAVEGGVETPDRYAPAPAEVSQGDVPAFEEINMPQWSGRTFRIDSGLKLKGPVESRLMMSGDTLTGQITNRTGLDLRACSVCFGNGRQDFTSIRDGETVTVSVSTPAPGIASATSLPVPGEFNNQNQIGNNVAGNIFGKVTSCREPVLVGWFEEIKIPVRLRRGGYAGENVGMALFHLRSETGKRLAVNLEPFNMVVLEKSAGVVATPRENGASIDMPASSNCILDFKPSSANATAIPPSSLRLKADYKLVGTSPVFLCLDWWTGKWDIMNGDPAVGMTLPNPADHHRRNSGAVRIKIATDAPVKNVNLRLVAE